MRIISSTSQRGDPLAREFLPRLAAALGVPFILFDPRAEDTDHWQPLWGDRPAEVVARVLAGIETSEPYYADVLRLHVGIIANVLHIAGYWPPSFPLLVDASQLTQFDHGGETSERAAAAATISWCSISVRWWNEMPIEAHR